MEGVVCYGVMIPARQPGEGPCAASITLLKVRATPERVPALLDDLRWLASEPVGPAPPVVGVGPGPIGPIIRGSGSRPRGCGPSRR